MASKDAPRSGPPMSEMPPSAARSREIAAERAAHSGPALARPMYGGLAEATAAMAAERPEEAERLTGGTAGEVVRPADAPTPEDGAPGRTAGDVPCWETGLSLSASVDFTALGRVAGPFTEDEACKLVAPIRMRQVGWLDQRGRVWLETPPAAGFDGGSLTPLLIQLSYDD